MFAVPERAKALHVAPCKLFQAPARPGNDNRFRSATDLVAGTRLGDGGAAQSSSKARLRYRAYESSLWNNVKVCNFFTSSDLISGYCISVGSGGIKNRFGVFLLVVRTIFSGRRTHGTNC